MDDFATDDFYESLPDFNPFLRNLSDSDTNTDSNGIRISFAVLRILICVLGIIGNLLVIFVVLVLHEYRKTITHWYVLHLAIADSIFLLSIPFKTVEDVNDKWMFSRALCKTTESVLFLNYFASVFLLAVMSLDRYIAVCHGRTNVFQKFRTRRAAYSVTCIIWIASLILCLPVFLYSDKRGLSPDCSCYYKFPRDSRQACLLRGCNTESEIADCVKEEEHPMPCRPDPFNISDWNDLIGDIGESTGVDRSVQATTTANVEERVYSTGCSYALEGDGWFHYLNFLFVIMFLLPLMVMSFCYALIIRQLHKTRACQNIVIRSSDGIGSMNRKLQRSLSSSTVKSERQFRRVNIICIALVLLFVCCWLPFHSYHIAMKHGINGSDTYCKDLGRMVSLFAYMNSALNPFIYNCIGTRFRARFRSAVKAMNTRTMQRTGSVSSSGGGKVLYKRKGDAGNSSGSGTVITRPHGKMGQELTSGEQDERCGMMVKEQSN